MSRAAGSFATGVKSGFTILALLPLLVMITCSEFVEGGWKPRG